MEEEQRGEALLPVERSHHPTSDLAVDEVEAYLIPVGECPMKHAEEVLPNPLRANVRPALRIVALDDRDLEFLDPVAFEHADEGLGLHATAAGVGLRYLRMPRSGDIMASM